MLDFVTKAINVLVKKCKYFGVFLNLLKAFDCIDHTDTVLSEGPWKECHAVRGISLEWIISSLIPRTQKVQVNSIISEDFKLYYYSFSLKCRLM